MSGGVAVGYRSVIPNASGTSNTAYGYTAQSSDATVTADVCTWYTVGSATTKIGVAGTVDYTSGGTYTPQGYLGWTDTSTYSAAGRFYNNQGGTEVSISDSAGYALNVRSGQIRYGSYTIPTFTGSTTTFLRGDATLSALAETDAPGFKNGTQSVVGIAGTGSTSVLKSFIGSDGATASDNFTLFTLSGSTYAGVFINQRGTTSTWSTFTSDARMKDIVGAIPVPSAIEAFKQIGKPIIWRWKFEQGQETWGYTAQQVGQGLPQALFESPMLPNGDHQKIPGTNERVLTFDNNKLQILKDLVIAELIARVEALEAKVGK
jgi:hypothetical protein